MKLHSPPARPFMSHFQPFFCKPMTAQSSQSTAGPSPMCKAHEPQPRFHAAWPPFLSPGDHVEPLPPKNKLSCLPQQGSPYTSSPTRTHLSAGLSCTLAGHSYSRTPTWTWMVSAHFIRQPRGYLPTPIKGYTKANKRLASGVLKEDWAIKGGER